MPVTCLVVGRRSRSNRVDFFSVSTILNHRFLAHLNDLSTKRRERWLVEIKRDDLTDSKLQNQRVCSKHFIAGKGVLKSNFSL